jgi:hypothetical protein
MNNTDKLMLTGLCLKSVTGVVGGSLIFAKEYPYWAIGVLSAGAIANEIISFIKARINKRAIESANE